MAPKRPAPGSSENPAKAARTDANNVEANNVEEPPKLPRNKRWKKISASGNADDAYKEQTRDPNFDAYSYECLCRNLDDRGSDEDDESDDEDEETEENANKEKIPCDGGETCLCLKPAEEHPGHPWVITKAATCKDASVRSMVMFRDPDTFGMHTYNDYFGYGCLEMAQNLVLDFDEAKGNWKEQWVVCETTALFFLKYADPMFMVDDGEGVSKFMDLVGTMVLTMLATLEREGLLKPDSEVKSLPMIMASFIRLVGALIGPDLGLESNGLDKKLFAYAKKHNIELKGLSDLEDFEKILIEKSKAGAEKVELPAPNAGRDDPWGRKKALAAYKKSHGPIGGDKMDLSTWTSAERKRHSFDNKDPLDGEMMDGIKNNLVVSFA